MTRKSKLTKFDIATTVYETCQRRVASGKMTQHDVINRIVERSAHLGKPTTHAGARYNYYAIKRAHDIAAQMIAAR